VRDREARVGQLHERSDGSFDGSRCASKDIVGLGIRCTRLRTPRKVGSPPERNRSERWRHSQREVAECVQDIP
jgi:hypothetical protein